MVSRSAVKRYHDRNILHVGINLNRSTEPELVEKVESEENRSGYIKALIRADIEAGRSRDNEE